MKFSANLTMLFNEYDFLDRFEAAAKAGFDAVEYISPYDYSPQEIKRRLDAFDLKQSLFNVALGDWPQGERGLACIPGRQAEFIDGVKLAIEYANVLGNQYLHVMAGVNPNVSSNTSDEVSAIDLDNCFKDNIRAAARLAKQSNLIINIEPINNVDMPGYFLNYQEDAVTFIEQINEENVRLQFDCYHCQMMQGDIVSTFKKVQSYVDYVQIAGVPGRHEPDIGELNYEYILNALKLSGYSGYIGCEYIPKAITTEGLHWKKAYSGCVKTTQMI